MAKKRKKKKRAKVAKVAVARAAAATSAGAIRNVVAQLTKYRDSLLAQQEELAKELQRVNDALETLSVGQARRAAAAAKPAAPVPRRGPGRGRRGAREGSLRSYIVKVLGDHGGPMAVREIAQAVLDAGYKSKNKKLASSISGMLREIPEVEKVGHGKYQLRKSA